MFQQYFKFIIRKLSRNRVYTVINIVEIVNGTIDLHHQEESGEKKGKEA